MQKKIDIAGFKFSVETPGPEKFSERAANFAGAGAYLITKTIAKRGYIDSSSTAHTTVQAVEDAGTKAYELGAEAKVKTIKLISHTKQSGQARLSEAIAEAGSVSGRVLKATDVKAKARVAKQLAPSAAKIIEIKQKATDAKQKAYDTIDAYCGADAPLKNAAVEAPIQRRKARKSQPQQEPAANLNDLIKQEVRG